MRRDVQEIFRNTPHEKQVMMFSATLSKEIRPVCKKFMQDVITPFSRCWNGMMLNGSPSLIVVWVWDLLTWRINSMEREKTDKVERWKIFARHPGGGRGNVFCGETFKSANGHSRPARGRHLRLALPPFAAAAPALLLYHISRLVVVLFLFMLDATQRWFQTCIPIRFQSLSNRGSFVSSSWKIKFHFTVIPSLTRNICGPRLL